MTETRKGKTKPESLIRVSKNLRHLFEAIGKDPRTKGNKASVNLPGLNYSMATFKNMLYADAKVSDKILKTTANEFSGFLKEEVHERISAEDFHRKPEEFAERFPEKLFNKYVAEKEHTVLDPYTEQVYRCYYRHPYSENKGLMAYMKLYHTVNGYRAYIIRGVTDRNQEPELVRLLKDYSLTEENFARLYADKEARKDKSFEGIHLCYAGNNDISVSPNCITIRFRIVNEDYYYSTMFWDVSLFNKKLSVIPSGKAMKVPYIGGVAYVVDTSDGHQHNDIRGFKVGMETIDEDEYQPNYPKDKKKNKEPYSSSSKDFLKELNLHEAGGVSLLYSSDDYRWYRYIQDSSNREVYHRSGQLGEIDALLEELRMLKSAYQGELLRMEKLLNEKESMKKEQYDENRDYCK